MSRLADIYKSEKTSGGGLGSTLGKAALEKIDPRKMFNQQGLMAAMLPALFKAYSATPKSRSNTMSSRLTTPNLNTGALESQLTDIGVNTRLTAKNTMVLPMMARDSNLTKLNIMKVVKLLGGKASKKSDMFWKDSAAREKEYESKFSKENSKSTSSSSGGSPAAAGGAGGLKGIGLDFLSSLAGGIGKGVGIAAIGLGIGGFFAGLAAGGAAVNQLGGASGVKDMLVNLAEGLGAFSGTSLLAFGALLGAGMLFGPSGSNPVKGAFKGLNMSIGIASIGLGLGGFLAGLAAGGAAIALLGGSGGVKTMLIDLAEGLGAFSGTSFLALSALLGPGMLFGAYAGVGKSLKGAVGMTAIGAGIGGFLLALSIAAGLIDLFGGGPKLKDLLINVAEGLGAFSESSLIALGGLFAAGSIFGATGLAGPAAIGIGLMGVGIGAFLSSLGLAAVVIDLFGGGPKLKDLLINIAEGLGAFSELDGMHLGKLALAIPLFGSAMFSFFSLEGIGGIIKSFTDGVKGVMDWIFGNNTDKTPMQRLAEDLKLFENINGDNLSKVGQGFKDLASGLLGFAKVTPEDLEKAVTAAGVAARLNKVIGGNQTTAPAKTGGNMTPEQIAALQADPYAEKKSSSPTKKGGMSSSTSPTKAPTALDITASTESGGRYDLAFGDVPKKDGTIVNVLGKSKNFPQLAGKVIMTPEEFSGKPLTEMTLAEVQAFQNYRNREAPNTNAVGKYQFMRTTLFGKDGKSGLVGQSKLSMDTIFNADTQELLQATMRKGNAAALRGEGVAVTDANLNLANAVGARGVATLLKPENANRNALDVLGLTGDAAKTNPQLNKLSKDVIAATYSKYDARGMAPGGSSGTVLASTSTSVADQKLALMSGPNGTTNINAPTTNNTVGAGGGSNSGGGVKLYNEALRVDALRMLI